MAATAYDKMMPESDLAKYVCFKFPYSNCSILYCIFFAAFCCFSRVITSNFCCKDDLPLGDGSCAAPGVSEKTGGFLPRSECHVTTRHDKAMELARECFKLWGYKRWSGWMNFPFFPQVFGACFGSGSFTQQNGW